MPDMAEAWVPLQAALTRLALGRAPPEVTRWLHSARVLALERPECDDGKVRPLALGMHLRRAISRAISRVFLTSVAAGVQPCEYSLGAGRGAEVMHRTVMLDLDARGDVVKLSFDVSNAHNEFCRQVAADEIEAAVPELMAWARPYLEVEALHAYTSPDGSVLELPKTRGGDQGDSVVNLLFPLAYRRASRKVEQVACNVDVDARTYSFQDDVELICKAGAISAARAAFREGCEGAGLRANLSKDRLSPGRLLGPSSPLMRGFESIPTRRS